MEKVKSFFKDKYNIALIIILILYSIISFYNLGSNSTPTSYITLNNGDYAIFEISGDRVPSYFLFLNGYKDGVISIFFANELSSDNQSFTFIDGIRTEYGDSYKWKYIDINEFGIIPKYILIESSQDNTQIGEIAIYDENRKKINLNLITYNGKELIDEQNKLCLSSEYMYNPYFDEIYFPRAAYELANQKYIFEYVHPTLGKLIMWIPMGLFGITPFTYRFMGNVAGIIIILLMYLVGIELFKDKKYGLFLAIIMALDGMHFVQTRIATVDSFLVMFGITSFLFFIKYLRKSNNQEKNSYLMLALSGFFWGCTISVKWSGAFIGAGLAILFFIDYFVNKRFRIKPIIMGILTFVLLPITVYLICHIPVFTNPNEMASYTVTNASGDKETIVTRPNSLQGFIYYEYSMYQYHSLLGTKDSFLNETEYTVHPYSSKWYTWPLMLRPMWYYEYLYNDGTKSTIACMGNPCIWWLSVVTLIATIVIGICKKDKIALNILVMALTTFLLYAFINREMYIYHYFIVLPFMMCTIVYAVKSLIDKFPKMKFLVPTLCVVFLISFAYFYPVFSGLKVPDAYIDSTKWLSSWVY